MAPVSDDNIYRYNPSIVASAIFIGVFAIFTVHHGYLMIRRRTWYWWPFFAGVLFEVVGFIIRIPSAKKPGDVGLYACQTLFILLPPSMFSASIYMALGRLLVYLKAQKASLVRVRWMTGCFVVGDVISFLMQAGGGGMQASDNASDRDTGSHIVIGGLIVQLIFFGGFVLTSIIADRRLHKWKYNPKTPGKFQWRQFMLALYAAALLILIRSVYRLVEYAQGVDAYIMRHEVFMYCFDSVLMAFVCLIFSIIYPGEVMLWDKPIEVEGNLQMSSWTDRKSKV